MFAAINKYFMFALLFFFAITFFKRRPYFSRVFHIPRDRLGERKEDTEEVGRYPLRLRREAISFLLPCVCVFSLLVSHETKCFFWLAGLFGAEKLTENKWDITKTPAAYKHKNTHMHTSK